MGDMAERGVADDRRILEDQAKRTKDHFRNTAQIIDPSEPVVRIGRNDHMDRAVQTAKATGFTQCPAPARAFVLAQQWGQCHVRGRAGVE